jgi:hypothetical protein
MSLLADYQQDFSQLVALLILKAGQLGFGVSLGEAWRSPEEAERKGFANSNHCRRLAIDLHLFRAGKYLARTEDHAELGAWWEAQDPRCRWGGHFNDGNHYSFDWRGVR